MHSLWSLWFSERLPLTCMTTTTQALIVFHGADDPLRLSSLEGLARDVFLGVPAVTDRLKVTAHAGNVLFPLLIIAFELHICSNVDLIWTVRFFDYLLLVIIHYGFPLLFNLFLFLLILLLVCIILLLLVCIIFLLLSLFLCLSNLRDILNKLRFMLW